MRRSADILTAWALQIGLRQFASGTMDSSPSSLKAPSQAKSSWWATPTARRSSRRAPPARPIITAARAARCGARAKRRDTPRRCRRSAWIATATRCCTWCASGARRATRARPPVSGSRRVAPSPGSRAPSPTAPAPGPRGAGAVGDGAREPGEGATRRLPETGGLARVARRAPLAHHVQHRVAVAIHADLLHRLGVSRRFALAPQRAARAAVIMGLAGGARLLERRAVGVPHHEDFACEGALSDDGDESIVPEANCLNPICRAHAVKISALRRIVKIPLRGDARHCGARLDRIYIASRHYLGTRPGGAAGVPEAGRVARNARRREDGYQRGGAGARGESRGGNAW